MIYDVGKIGYGYIAEDDETYRDGWVDLGVDVRSIFGSIRPGWRE